MAGLCRAPGCGKPATRYGHFCTTHKSRWRRHGDVGQVGITKEVLKPYADLVRARIEKNVGNLCTAVRKPSSEAPARVPARAA